MKHITNKTNQLYEKNAIHYDKDPYNIITNSHQIGIEHISTHCKKKSLTIFDFALGTGNFIVELSKKIQISHVIGNDLSKSMLEIAKSKFNNFTFQTTVICENALNVHRHIEPLSQDLVLIHFLYDYCDIHTLLTISRKLLKPKGLLSILTSTKQSCDDFFYSKINELGFIKKMIQQEFESYIVKNSIPLCHNTHLMNIEKYGFSIVEERNHMNAISFSNFNEICNFNEVGWMSGYISQSSRLKTYFLKLLLKYIHFLKPKFYPIHFNLYVSAVLAELN